MKILNLISLKLKGKEKTHVINFLNIALKKDNFWGGPVTKLKLKNMDHLNKMVKETNADNKITEYKKESNVIAKLLVKALDKDVNLDIANILTYGLTPTPDSIGTADDFLSKNYKTKSFGNLTKDIENALNPQGNGLTIKTEIFCSTSSSRFQVHSRKFVKTFTICFDQEKSLVFSTDMYSLSSIKSPEKRR